MADSDSDEAPEIGTIAALAGDVSSDEEEDVTPPMPVLFLSHGGGPCIHTSVADAPQFEGIDKVKLHATVNFTQIIAYHS
jgi:hypothetical protein